MAQSGNCRITVVGSNMVDLVSYLHRVPERGETVFGRSFDQGFGGKGANQAVMAALLGGQVDIVTCVGDDLFGPKWFDHFREHGVGINHVSTIAGIYSGVAAIWVEPTGDNRIVLGSGANDHLTPSLVDKAFDDIDATHVVLSQLEIPQPAIVRGFVHARARGAATVLNPGPAAALGRLQPTVKQRTRHESSIERGIRVASAIGGGKQQRFWI
ncbi:PfkB family carbohydrate kinase [Pseudaminobacter sp. NGMCC 1.201702]|uniref:PfkB family carbohydrate kinase n=1 Tax=Pseudaminobacter sp. NGMCC 1.201702 TaxID=3391825 RepID=UPI0039EF4B5A